MEISEDRLVKVCARLISKNKDDDPITLSEKIVERIREEMELADGGYDMPRATIKKEPELVVDEDIRQRWSATRPKSKVTPLREEPVTGAPQASGSRLVIGPDDPEFQQAERMTEADRRRGVVPTQSVRLSRVNNPSGGPAAPPTKFWSYESCIQQIQQNTPQERWFHPNNTPADVQIKAVRNIHAQIGLDMVRLTYANPGVSADGPRQEAAVIGLTAKHDFLLTDQNFDWDKVMDDIVAQLAGLYGPKKLNSAVELPPSPMERWSNSQPGMKEDAVYQMPSDGSMTADPFGEVFGSVTQANSSTGNPFDRK